MTDSRPPSDQRDAANSPDAAAAPPTPAEYEVPPDADPLVCTHCGAPFADERLLALHRGIDHADALDAAQREAFEDAYDREEDDLRLFRLKALGALVVLYFGLLIAYSVFA